MKKRIGIVLLAVCLFTLSAGSTAAIFTAVDTARNVITTGQVALSLVERQRTADGSLQPYPAQPVAVMPGQRVSKEVAVSNTAAQPAWVRARVELNAPEKGNLPLERAVILQGLGEGWSYNSADGWYYCSRVLAPGEETVPLFREAVFSASDMDNAFAGTTLTISVMAQGVQSANNGATVWQAAGWPAEETAGGDGT